MKTWITIFAFTYPHEAHIAKAKLESEGIEVMLKDELTVQVNNFYSGAIGGVKLQVQENNVIPAQEILKETGVIQEQVFKRGKLIAWIDKTTSYFPFVGKSLLELRLLVFVFILLLMIIIPLSIFSMPSTQEKVVGRWCINRVVYKEKVYAPYTYGIKSVSYNCYENFVFLKDGTVKFPGFKSRAVLGHWGITDDIFEIFDCDTLGYLYNGRYELEVSSDIIDLKSKTTRITGYQN